MEKKIKELEDLVKLQDRQIRELKNAITKLHKHSQNLEKKLARTDHTMRGQTITINKILSILKKD